MYTEVQQITLRDILTNTGLTQRQVEDIFLLLRFKPERVQLAFYYRACGNTYEEIGEMLSISHNQVMWDVSESCKDIKKYLENVKKH